MSSASIGFTSFAPITLDFTINKLYPRHHAAVNKEVELKALKIIP
jgi:hypothetical protein